jgi:thioredoxin 1
VRIRVTLLAFFIFLLFLLPSYSGEAGEIIPQAPVEGMVTMLDLGAKKCIPCKMMAPIIEELKEEYDGKAAIVFIDVWQHPQEARKYRIQAIPTQIFYDESGGEVFRHVGFMDKKSIVRMLEKLIAK